MSTSPPNASAAPDGPGRDPFEPLLDHARLIWKAEEENARRLAVRANLNLTVMTAALGAALAFGLPRLLLARPAAGLPTATFRARGHVCPAASEPSDAATHTRLR